MCHSTNFMRIDSAHWIWRIGILARSPSLPCWNSLVQSIRGREGQRQREIETERERVCVCVDDVVERVTCMSRVDNLNLRSDHVEWRVKSCTSLSKERPIPAIRLQHGEKRSSIRRMRHASLSSPTRLWRMRSSRAGRGYRCSLGSLDQPVHPD